VTLKNETLVFCLNKGEASRNAGEDRGHAASDDLLECLDEREFLLVEGWGFGDGEHEFARLPFLQLAGDVIYKEFIAGDGQSIL